METGRREERQESALLYLAGVDEAGLGPLLGSLAIGYCVLGVPLCEPDPWRCLRSAVAKTPRAKKRLVVADSKLLFRRNALGERRLEVTALSFLTLLERVGPVPFHPERVLFADPGPSESFVRAHPWYARLPRLPRANQPDTIDLASSVLARAFTRSGAMLLDAGVRLVPAGELNASFAETRNKWLTVWSKTLEVLRRLWTRRTPAGLQATVDMLGGRRHYRPLLAEAFPDSGVDTQEETEGRSAYLLEALDGSGRMELEFRVAADRTSFPVALASCIAKYAREVEMHAFNAFFGELAPELRPTAGYRRDGHRWLADAASVIAGSGIAREVLVRVL